LIHKDFDSAGWYIWIDRLLGAAQDDSADRNDPFRPENMSPLVAFFRILGIEDQLDETGSVPQIDENDAAVVSSSQHPAEKTDALINIRLGNFSA
jgi:hypothetical protein